MAGITQDPTPAKIRLHWPVYSTWLHMPRFARPRSDGHVWISQAGGLGAMGIGLYLLREVRTLSKVKAANPKIPPGWSYEGMHRFGLGAGISMCAIGLRYISVVKQMPEERLLDFIQSRRVVWAYVGDRISSSILTTCLGVAAVAFGSYNHKQERAAPRAIPLSSSWIHRPLTVSQVVMACGVVAVGRGLYGLKVLVPPAWRRRFSAVG